MLTVCPDPGRRVSVLYVVYIAFLFLLFANFSKKTYTSKDNKNA